MLICGCGGIGRRTSLRSWRFGVQVRPLSPAPRRRGLCIVRDDFSFEKSSAHSRRRLPSCGSRLLFGGLTLTEDRRLLRQPFSPCIRRRRRSKMLPLSAKVTLAAAVRLQVRSLSFRSATNFLRDARVRSHQQKHKNIFFANCNSKLKQN